MRAALGRCVGCIQEVKRLRRPLKMEWDLVCARKLTAHEPGL